LVGLIVTEGGILPSAFPGQLRPGRKKENRQNIQFPSPNTKPCGMVGWSYKKLI
jgi:hypothetical protein